MPTTPEDQAQAFLHHIALHQDKLLSYAQSLSKCPDRGHDLYSDTLMSCYERILSAGFTGTGYLPYMVTALRFNHQRQQSKAKKLLPLAGMERAQDEAHPEDNTQLATAISAYVAQAYNPEQVAVFELHVAGLTYNEITFLTDFTYWQAYELVRKMKRELRAQFKH